MTKGEAVNTKKNGDFSKKVTAMTMEKSLIYYSDVKLYAREFY